MYLNWAVVSIPNSPGSVMPLKFCFEKLSFAISLQSHKFLSLTFLRVLESSLTCIKNIDCIYQSLLAL